MADGPMNLDEIRRSYLEQRASHHDDLMNSAEGALTIQKVQTIGIAVMVIGMVVFALWLSYLQFKRDIDSKGQSVTKLKIGTGSIEISSSVIGLIILAISLWFFQTYVNNVYTLNPIDIPAIDAVQFSEEPKQPQINIAVPKEP